MYIVSLKNHMTSVVTGNILVISNHIIVFAVPQVLGTHFLELYSDKVLILFVSTKRQ